MQTIDFTCRANLSVQPRGLQPRGFGHWALHGWGLAGCSGGDENRRAWKPHITRRHSPLELLRATDRAIAAPPAMQELDRNWYEQSYKEYAGLVYAFVKSRVKSSAAADDLTQQIWLKVWTQAAKQFDGSNFARGSCKLHEPRSSTGFARPSRINRRPRSMSPSRPQAEPEDEDLTAALRACLETISAEFSHSRPRTHAQPAV